MTLPAEEFLPQQRYAFIGDLTWQLDGITARAERPLLLRALADSDPAGIRRDLDRIALSDRVQVVPAHGARRYDGIPRLGTQPLPEVADARTKAR